MILRVLILVICLIPMPLFAVEPDEILDDPVLEHRARNISKVLRCLVCRNENIDSSNADIARDLRLLVRERLVAGQSDKDVMEFIVARYGEYVLLKPPVSGANAPLYLIGPTLFLLGATFALLYVRRRSKSDHIATELSSEEARRIAKLMRD